MPATEVQPRFSLKTNVSFESFWSVYISSGSASDFKQHLGMKIFRHNTNIVFGKMPMRQCCWLCSENKPIESQERESWVASLPCRLPVIGLIPALRNVFKPHTHTTQLKTVKIFPHQSYKLTLCSV